MKLMLFELIDIGFFQCFVAWKENPWLFCANWFVLLLAAGIQALLLKKGKNYMLMQSFLEMDIYMTVTCISLRAMKIL